MTEAGWDMQKVKHFKKKQLVQCNFVIVLLFMLSVYYAEKGGSVFAYFNFLCVLIWMISAYTLYVAATGKTIGTKTSKFIQNFDRDRLGERRWKKRRIIEAAVTGALAVICTVLAVVMDYNADSLEIRHLFPIIGSWLGYNIGEIVRIGSL